ncbi:hypothetical protein J6590_097667 [Homalodisca vitripennis]|nr:hypothetical protein J6590_097667 [Homalodisca vitripennis]
MDGVVELLYGALPQEREPEPLRLLDSVYPWVSPLTVMDEGLAHKQQKQKIR